LEVPVMMAIAVRPSYFLGRRGIVIGFVALALYFIAAGLAPSSGALVWAQILRAVGIGLVSCIGISYLQDLIPNRVGAASVLYANTNQIGQLLAGLGAGAWAQAYNYHSLFWPCAVVSVAGLACIAAGRRSSRSAAVERLSVGRRM
jgi:MFS transporter, SET family, sugar efflux transporter